MPPVSTELESESEDGRNSRGLSQGTSGAPPFGDDTAPVSSSPSLETDNRSSNGSRAVETLESESPPPPCGDEA
eukprot:3798895-Lingulodinium_polyedra.AAC.1